MSIQNNELPNNPSIESETVRPFRRFCTTIMTIGTLPSSYQEAMSYQELLLWLCDFIENTIIPAFDNNANAITELQNLYVELKSYVDNYFTDLDVQEEINKKLDELAQNGTLETIMKPYFNEFQTSLEQYQNNVNSQINNIQNNVNSQINNIQNNVNSQINNLEQQTTEQIQNSISSISNGTPLVVNTIEQMTNTSRIYVNTSDGYWYYYNGSSWVKGGVYQATEIGDREVGLKNLNYVFSDNSQMFNKENVTYDKYINTKGNLVNVEDNYKYCVSDFIPVEEHHIYARTYNPAQWSKAFYDENKQFINTDFNAYKFSPVVAPLNAKYFRFSIRGNTSEELKEILDSFVFNEGFVPNKYTPYYKNFDELTYFLNIDKFLTKQLDNSINIFNNKYYTNAYIQSNGGLDEPVDGHIYYTTDLIECTQNDTIYSNQDMRYIGEWDENYNFLNRTNALTVGNTQSFKPTNSQTKYIAITYYENDFDNNLLMITKNNKYDNYIPNYNINIPYKSITKEMLSDNIFDNSENLYFSDKTVNFLGDSITYGYDGAIPNNTNNVRVEKPYPVTVQETLGLLKANNYGVSGAAISGGSNPLYINYANMTNNADYVIVFAGTNDWQGSIYGQPLG